MIGFSGASRTGKTTLGRLVAEQLGFGFHEVKTAEILKAAGFDGVSDLSIEDRISAQEAYLAHYARLIETLPRPVIVDRTPIDLIGYLMAEVGMFRTTPEQGERIRDFSQRALTMANRNFALIFMPCPLGSYQTADGKAPANSAYQWHTQWLMEGASGMLKGPTLVKITSTDLETRVAGCSQVVVDWLEKTAEQRASSRLH